MTVLGATSPPRFPIGHSDYLQLRRSGLTYVDKTRWVAEVLDDPALVTLIPRPRRFGKTLNMTTLRYFVERTMEARADVFEDTAVWTLDGGRFRSEFQRYPVIYLSFKDIKGTSWRDQWIALQHLLYREVHRVLQLVAAAGLAPPSGPDAAWLESAVATREPAHWQDVLARLTEWLQAATGERVVVLIDEYDAPLHAAWQHGFWDDAVGFYRNLLSGGLKDNPYLRKAVMTGILKVAKEGIFSGLNHLKAATILGDHLVDAFGFTEDEVAELAAATGASHNLEAIQRWYNGYRFGDARPATMYNPWSIINYLAEPGTGPRAFWKNTSDNALIHTLLMRHAAAVGPDVETLLSGGSIERVVDENVALNQLNVQVGAVIGLLLFSGYLTAAEVRPTEAGVAARLRIPNLEVFGIYADTFRKWLQQSNAQAGSAVLERLVAAMLEGHARTVERTLGHLLVTGMSVFDFGVRPVEAVYQAFVVGLLLHLDRSHLVRSNREAGYGRADVLITPRQPGPGAVLELKVVDTDDEETVETALESAVAQLRTRNYAAEVLAAGATTVHQYGIVFDGKRCWVERVDA